MNFSAKNRGFSLFSILVISVLFSGCPAQHQANQARTAFQVEAEAYREFETAANQRGEIPIQKLALWASALESLEGLMANTQVSEHMARTYAGEIHQLRLSLQSVAERKFNHKIQIPQWHLDRAIETKEKIHRTLQGLNEQYDRIFPGMRIAEMFSFDDRMLVLVRDVTLRDVRPDCVDLVRSYFQTPLCLMRAEALCSHQADLDCVEEHLDENEDAGCLAAAGTAGWMEKIGSCVSVQPISY